MTLLRRFTIVSVLALALVLTGCGTSTSVSLGNSGGPFTNANLNGTYAFSVRGQNTFGFFAMAGSFQANGAGNLFSGVMDINSGGTGGIRPNVPFTGTYSVRGNGQGTATLVTSFQNFTLDFVIISSQRALLIRFDNNATASGSIDLQSSTAFSNAALGGGFVFNLAGVDAAGNTFATIGAIATDGAGTITSGVQDLNDNDTPTTNVPLTGSYSVASNGRGTMILNSAIGTLNFVFYVVDGNRLKLVEIDTSPAFAGDAVRQVSTPSNASLSGPFVFTLGGFTGGLPLAICGTFTTDGAGNITSGFEDVNDAGTMTANNTPVTGTYSIGANGRGTATLNSGENFAIYPTVNGAQIMGINISEITFGSALAQQGTAFSNSSVQGAYGMNLTGFTSTGEIDENGQFTASGTGTLNGALDINNTGGVSPGLSLTGTYSVSANGRGTASFHSSFQTQNFIFYVVSSSRVVFIESDSNVTVGDFEHQ